MKKRKTKRQKVILAQKRQRQEDISRPQRAISKARKRSRQVADLKTVSIKSPLNLKTKKADKSTLFDQTKLIKKDLLKSVALSFFILTVELVLYWRLS